MSVTVTCPECNDRYEVADAAAEEMVRCRRCQCPIEPNRREPLSNAIKTKPSAVLTSTKHEDDERYGDEARPRAPFPWVALLVIAIGLLFFLLAFSVGFNIWFISQPENRRRMEKAGEAEPLALMRLAIS